MGALIWIGALVSLIGVGLLVYCIASVMKAKKNADDDADLNTKLQSLAAVNMAALAVSAIGLMLVVIGILLR